MSLTKKIPVLAVSLGLVVALSGGCDQVAKVFRKEKAPAEPPKIAAQAGWKYYVGGPVMVPDGFGRFRIGEFQGEISKPSARGFLVGVKHDPNKKFEMATWINGLKMMAATGFIGRQGIYFITHRTALDGQGRVMSKQTLEYDDEHQLEKSVLEYFDPETGELVHTAKSDRPYRPPPDEEKKDDFLNSAGNADNAGNADSGD